MPLLKCQAFSPPPYRVNKCGNVYPLRMSVKRKLRKEDSINLRILKVVGQKGRAKSREISEAIHLSRSAVLSRTRKLEKKGLLIKEVESLPATGIRPVHFFRLVPELSVTLIQDLLSEVIPGDMVISPAKSAQAPSQKPKKELKRVPLHLPSRSGDALKLQARTFKVLQIITAEESVVVADLSQRLNETRGNIHTSLQQLIKLGLISREERTTKYGREHVYFLVPEVSKEELIDALDRAKAEAQGIIGQIEDADDLDLLPSDRMQGSGDAVISRRPNTIEILVSRLPEFDPSWSAEVQAKWLESYQRLIEISQSNN